MEFDFDDDYRSEPCSPNPVLPPSASHGGHPIAALAIPQERIGGHALPPPLPPRAPRDRGILDDGPSERALAAPRLSETSLAIAPERIGSHALPPPLPPRLPRDRLVLEDGLAEHTFAAPQFSETPTVCTRPRLPEEPTEEAFVSAHARIRQQEYERLESWILAGGDARPFLPWFREMLMDADSEAFVAACRAVTAHYREEFRYRGQTDRTVTRPNVWLLSLAERVRAACGIGAGPVSHHFLGADRVADVIVAACACCESDVWSCLRVLLREEHSSLAGLCLLCVCVDHGAFREDTVCALFEDAALRRRLSQSDDVTRQMLGTLLDKLPTLRDVFASALPSVCPTETSARKAETRRLSAVPSPEHSGRVTRMLPLEVPVSQEVQQILNDTSVKSWRDRLACLQKLNEGDGICGPALWPQLVLQAEDDHPAVSAEALRAIGRLVHCLGDPGDHLATRLAVAVRAKLREGRSRGIEAARACVVSLAKHGGLSVGPLSHFLAQAVGCTRERARAAVLALGSPTSGEVFSTSAGVEACSSPEPLETSPVEAMLNLAVRPSSAAPRRRRLSTRDDTTLTSTGTIPPRIFTPIASPSPARTDTFSISPEKALGVSWVSPVEHATPSTLFMPIFSPDVADEPSMTTLPSRVPARTPSRYAHLAESPEWEQEASVRRALPPSSSAALRGSAAIHPETPPRQRGAYTRNSPQIADPVANLLARTPPPRLPPQLGEHSSTPGPRAVEGTPVGRVEQHDGDRTSACNAKEDILPIRQQSTCSLSGPQLQADSKFLSPSRTFLSSATRASMSPSVAAGSSAQKEETNVEILNAVAAGLRALEAGGDLSPWRDALRVMASCEDLQSNDDTDVIVQMLLKVAPRLATHVRPELWCALTELKDARWFPNTALLEIALVHCIHCLDPAVISSFLAMRIGLGSLQPSECIEFCLRQILAADAHHARLAQLFHALVTTLNENYESLLGDLALPSLPDVVDRAAAGRLTSGCTHHFCAGVELLLKHLEPASIPEGCWTQLQKLLSRQKGGKALTITQSPMQEAPDHQDEYAVDLQILQASDVPQQEENSTPAMELNISLARVHKLSVDLTKAGGEEVAVALQSITQILSRPHLAQPLRALLRRLLVRQRARNVMKENIPPTAYSDKKPVAAAGPAMANDFIDADYASVRELAADEGLVGAFPLSLLGCLRRLLMTPANASTHRAAVECLSATIMACGPLLLRIVLQMFASTLLRLAGQRGPAQVPARATLRQFLTLNELTPASGVEPAPALRLLRLVWRNLAQIIGRRSGAATDPTLLMEALRWLCQDALQVPSIELGSGDMREFLVIIIPSLQDRNNGVRSAAAKALQMLSQVRGDSTLREDVRGHPLLSSSVKATTLSFLTNAPTTPGTPAAWTPLGGQNIARRSPAAHGSGTQFLNIPAVPASFCGSAARSSSSKPRRLQFSPTGEEQNSGEANVVSPLAPPRLRTKAKSIAASIESESAASLGLANEGNGVKAKAATHNAGLISSPSAPSLSVTRRRAETRGANAQSKDEVICRSPFRPPIRAAASPLRSSAHRSRSADVVSSQRVSADSDLESDLLAWKAELESDDLNDVQSEWPDRVQELTVRLERFFLHSANDVAPVVLATLALCEGLVRRAADQESSASLPEAATKTLAAVLPSAPSRSSHQLLTATAGVAGAARAAFSPTALRRGFCAASAAAAFRSGMRALALLQQLSSGGSGTAAGVGKAADSLRNASARALLELPPLLAALIDALEASTQLVAWVRVAGEILAEGPLVEDSAGVIASGRAMRRWSLRFCARCVGRCAPLLPTDGLEFPAWEVLLELSRLHSQRVAASACSDEEDKAWADDCEEWCSALESAAVIVSQRCPTQAREFFLLASCTGSPLPASLERVLSEIDSESTSGT